MLKSILSSLIIRMKWVKVVTESHVMINNIEAWNRAGLCLPIKDNTVIHMMVKLKWYGNQCTWTHHKYEAGKAFLIRICEAEGSKENARPKKTRQIYETRNQQLFGSTKIFSRLRLKSSFRDTQQRKNFMFHVYCNFTLFIRNMY